MGHSIRFGLKSSSTRGGIAQHPAKKPTKTLSIHSSPPNFLAPSLSQATDQLKIDRPWDGAVWRHADVRDGIGMRCSREEWVHSAGGGEKGREGEKERSNPKRDSNRWERSSSTETLGPAKANKGREIWGELKLSASMAEPRTMHRCRMQGHGWVPWAPGIAEIIFCVWFVEGFEEEEEGELTGVSWKREREGEKTDREKERERERDRERGERTGGNMFLKLTKIIILIEDSFYLIIF